jgi:hypothetical protein
MPEMALDLPRRKSADSSTVATRRTRVANGSQLWPRVDGRSLWARRAGELLAAHIADLGGESNVSEAERVLVKRVAVLVTELERREAVFAQKGHVEDGALQVYQTAVNTLRRTLEALGLERRPRNVTPSLSELLALDQRQQRGEP